MINREKNYSSVLLSDLLCSTDNPLRLDSGDTSVIPEQHRKSSCFNFVHSLSGETSVIDAQLLMLSSLNSWQLPRGVSSTSALQQLSRSVVSQTHLPYPPNNRVIRERQLTVCTTAIHLAPVWVYYQSATPPSSTPHQCTDVRETIATA